MPLALTSDFPSQCCGAAFWSKEDKRRRDVIGSDDLFDLFNKKLNELASSSAARSNEASSIPSAEMTTQVILFSGVPRPTATERVAQRRQSQELRELETWIDNQQQHPLIADFLNSHSQKVLVNTRLDEQKHEKSSTTDAIELMTQLRHTAAVCAKSAAASVSSRRTRM